MIDWHISRNIKVFKRELVIIDIHDVTRIHNRLISFFIGRRCLPIIFFLGELYFQVQQQKAKKEVHKDQTVV